MRRAPKDHRALCHAVQYVDSALVEKGLTPADKNILSCIAGDARSASGYGARPGNVNLCVAASLKLSAMLRRVQILIGKALIERTEIGDGRKKASVYRICWEHPAYPDRAPGGKREWFIEADSECLAENIPNEAVKHSEGQAETFRRDAVNIPNEPRKHSAPDSEDNRRSTEEQQTIHPNPKPSATSGGWMALVENLPAMMKKEIPLLPKSDLAAFKTLVAQEGAPLTLATVTLWIDERPMSVEDLRQLKCRAFLKEYAPYLEKAKANTPEARAAKQRQEDQQQEAAAAFSRKCALEQWPEEFEAEETLEETHRKWLAAK